MFKRSRSGTNLVPEIVVEGQLLKRNADADKWFQVTVGIDRQNQTLYYAKKREPTAADKSISLTGAVIYLPEKGTPLLKQNRTFELCCGNCFFYFSTDYTSASWKIFKMWVQALLSVGVAAVRTVDPEGYSWLDKQQICFQFGYHSDVNCAVARDEPSRSRYIRISASIQGDTLQNQLLSVFENSYGGPSIASVSLQNATLVIGKGRVIMVSHKKLAFLITAKDDREKDILVSCLSACSTGKKPVDDEHTLPRMQSEDDIGKGDDDEDGHPGRKSLFRRSSSIKPFSQQVMKQRFLRLDRIQKRAKTSEKWSSCLFGLDAPSITEYTLYYCGSESKLTRESKSISIIGSVLYVPVNSSAWMGRPHSCELLDKRKGRAYYLSFEDAKVRSEWISAMLCAGCVLRVPTVEETGISRDQSLTPEYGLHGPLKVSIKGDRSRNLYVRLWRELSQIDTDTSTLAYYSPAVLALYNNPSEYEVISDIRFNGKTRYQPHSSDPFTIVVIAGDNGFFLTFANKREKTIWVEALQTALQSQLVRPTKPRKSLNAADGAGPAGTADMADMTGPNKQTRQLIPGNQRRMSAPTIKRDALPERYTVAAVIAPPGPAPAAMRPSAPSLVKEFASETAPYRHDSVGESGNGQSKTSPPPARESSRNGEPSPSPGGNGEPSPSPGHDLGEDVSPSRSEQSEKTDTSTMSDLTRPGRKNLLVDVNLQGLNHSSPSGSKPRGEGMCEECDNCVAAWQCADCGQLICDSCETRIHAKGKRARHEREPWSPPEPELEAAEVKNPAAFQDNILTESRRLVQDASNNSVTHPCEECDVKKASRKCEDCDQVFCATCDTKIHLKGKRSRHQRADWSPAPVASARACEECDENAATWQCSECDMVFCPDCEAYIHMKGRRAMHTRQKLSQAVMSPLPPPPPQPPAKPMCEECEDEQVEAVWSCLKCESVMCEQCNLDLHRKGTRKNHERELL